MNASPPASITKSVVCHSCDCFCPVAAKVDADTGRVTKVTTRDHPFFKDVICMKGAYAPKSFAHPDRLMQPQQRIGERGEGKWQAVSWDEALDDIAERLGKVIDQHGPEALAVAGSNANLGLDNGLTRRFMNLVGTPNFISGIAYCMGNTAAVSRLVYGWYPRGDLLNTKCIVLFGHDPRRHSWTIEYKTIRTAQAAGAKLIVLDPRKSENAEAADIWLPLRAGTDAAMTFGWLNVILEEELYDADFVRDWTVGFDAFAERVREYPLDRVADITGVDPALIRDAARMYATTKPAAIPWSPITDQQVSSTSAIRLQCALRAITGNLDVKGGEIFSGFNPGIRSDSEVELHHALPLEQQRKQLGADEFPVFTYRGMAPLGDATERVWGHRYANLVGGCYMANPSAVFKAMADGEPYPVKAFFALANNTLMSFANTNRIYKALLNQDLIVAYEHMLTPTAQLADYVLPGDSWLERPGMMAGISDRAMAAPGECRSIVYFWCQLAQRLGLGEHFPWQTEEELLDFRLAPGATTWAEVVASGSLPKAANAERKYEQTGFATPSGKVELHSSVLEGFGFDPLPYYRETVQPDERFPLMMFIGLPDDEYYRTGHRHIPEMRKRAQDPGVLRERDGPGGDWSAGGRLGARGDIDGRHGRARLRPVRNARRTGARAARLVEARINSWPAPSFRRLGVLRRADHPGRRPRLHRPRARHPAHERRAVLARQAHAGRGGRAGGGVRADDAHAERAGEAHAQTRAARSRFHARRRVRRGRGVRGGGAVALRTQLGVAS